MSTIVENQRRAFLARSMDAARRLADEFSNLSDPQCAAVLAVIAAARGVPVDLVYIADQGDIEEIASVLDGVLLRGDTPNSYLIGSGCTMTVVPAPGTENHE